MTTEVVNAFRLEMDEATIPEMMLSTALTAFKPAAISWWDKDYELEADSGLVPFARAVLIGAWG